MFAKEVIFILVTIGLIGIAWQDFKDRSINIYWLASTGLLVIAQSLIFCQFQTLATYFVINSLVLLIEIATVWLYFSIKHKHIVNLSGDFLGWGDIIFMFIMATSFHPLFFVIFILLCCLIALISYGVFAIIQKETVTVPLAAILAIGYLLVTTSWLAGYFNPFAINDTTMRFYSL